jgi:anti-sigma regulatory factor (Ser/Thr protein kinase)
MDQVLMFVAGVCQQACFKKIERLRVEMVIEELFTNTVHHGYGQDCEQPVWIVVEVQSGQLCITYQDAATPYNPLHRSAVQAEPDIGGLGVRLIENMAQTDYRYVDGRNTLILKFSSSLE